MPARPLNVDPLPIAMPDVETTLDVEATLEVDPRDDHIIDEWDAEQLRHKLWEMLETSVRVTLQRGDKPIRATLRFGTPTPYELKLARLGGGDRDGTFSESLRETFLCVYWNQAEPSPQEVAALHAIDPRLKGKTLAEAAAELKGKDWWHLGHFRTDADAAPMEAALRASGFRVERGWT